MCIEEDLNIDELYHAFNSQYCALQRTINYPIFYNSFLSVNGVPIFNGNGLFIHECVDGWLVTPFEDMIYEYTMFVSDISWYSAKYVLKRFKKFKYYRICNG